MSGILVGERACVGVEHRVEESYKLSRSGVCTQELVQLGTDHLRRCLAGGEGAKGCLKIRHEQRGGDSFSGDIAHANAEAIFAQLNRVEVVATDFPRRLPGSGDLNSGKLRQRAGQQHLLNLARSLEFFLLLLERDGPFLDSLLQLLITFSQLSLEFFHTKQDNVTDHLDDDDEITDPGEEKRERLAINFGQLQEENRAHGANHPE